MKMRLRDPVRPIAPDSGHDAQLQQPGSVKLPILDTYTSCHVANILQTERSISLLYVLTAKRCISGSGCRPISNV